MNKKIMIGVAIVVAACLVAIGIYFGYRPEEPEEPPSDNVQNEENIQNMMMETIAIEKGVSKENVRICFYEQTMDNNIFAAGAVLREGGSIVFLYDKTAREITQTEVEFVPTTNEEFQALSITVGKISPWTGEEIVPTDFTKTDNTYGFKYYDEYLSLLSRWSYGWATLYLDNETIEWGAHTL